MTNLSLSDRLVKQMHKFAEENGQSIEAMLYALLESETGARSQPLDDRIQQQQAIAEFGLKALTHHELPDLITEALDTICDVLNISYVKIFEYQQHNRTLFLKAGRGWQDGYVGTYSISKEVDSLAMYALSAKGSVVVPNLQEDPRLQGAGILHDHGIVSSMAVIINGKDHPYGVLCAHSDEPRTFTLVEVHFFQAIANVLANAIQRLDYESHIRYQAQLLDSTYDAIIATDEQFRITAWNKAAERLYGWQASDALGMNVEDVMNFKLGDEQWADALNQLKTTGFYTIELTQQHRDGGLIYVESKIITLEGENSQITGFLAVNRDISERKRLGDTLRQHAKQSEISAQISRLAAGVGLEYRAVLDVIVREITTAIGDMCVITTLSDDGKWLIPESYFHPDPIVMKHIQQIYASSDQPVEGAIADMIEQGKPIMLKEMSRKQADSFVASDYKSYLDISGMHGLMIVPLIARSVVIGTLGVSRTAPGRPYTSNDLHFLQLLAAQVSLCIQNAKLHDEIRVGRDNLRLLTQELVSAQEAERKRLSQELHDETGQALTALKLQLEQLLKLEDAGQLRNQVSGLITLTDNTIGYIRTLAQNLRPPALDMLGLAVAVEEYCVEFEKRTGYAIDYYAEHIPPTSDAINITLYRVLQEALTNVARHAEATHIDVVLRYKDGDIILKITDDGVGFDAKPILDMTFTMKSLGLIGMKERLEKLGGTLTIHSSSNTGTKLIARVPQGGES